MKQKLSLLIVLPVVPKHHTHALHDPPPLPALTTTIAPITVLSSSSLQRRITRLRRRKMVSYYPKGFIVTVLILLARRPRDAYLEPREAPSSPGEGYGGDG